MGTFSNYQWCRSLDCHNLAQLVLHLRQSISLGNEVSQCIASFLKFPVLSIVARTEAGYAFWNASGWRFEMIPFGGEQWTMIACDFNLEVFAFTSRFCQSFDKDVVKVVSVNQRQDIMDVMEPSVAFSSNGKKCAVLVETPDKDPCIALYEVLDDGNSVLGNRREFFIRFPAEDLPLERPLAFSSDGSTLALEGDSVGFIDVLSGNSQWTRGNAVASQTRVSGQGAMPLLSHTRVVDGLTLLC